MIPLFWLYKAVTKFSRLESVGLSFCSTGVLFSLIRNTFFVCLMLHCLWVNNIAETRLSRKDIFFAEKNI